MLHLIQGGKVRSQVINVPQGLPELLSDITREVLRCQPTTECLCQFVIDYLHTVIVTRDKARIAKSIIDRALRIVDDVIADMCICDINQSKAAYMCQAMEECFQRFLAQKRCEKGKNKEVVKYNEFDMLDELIQKCKFTDDELKTTKPIIEAAYQKFVNAYMTARDSSEGTEILYQYFREREMARIAEAARQEAAVRIQARFRGYLDRRSLFDRDSTKLPRALELEIEDLEKQRELAARKIQNFYRNRLTNLKSIDIVKSEKLPDEPCAPASDISLTATERRDEIKDDEFIPDNVDEASTEDKPNEEITTEKVDPDADLKTEDVTEDVTNE